VDVEGNRQLVCIERPGESIGSVVWPGAFGLIRYLHKNKVLGGDGRLFFFCFPYFSL
jgi:hypothetical protein